jgi:CSLREA domain-containing protein
MVDGMLGRRRYRVLAMALAVLACVLAVPAIASAREFIVDSTADEADLLIDGNCLTEGGKCTLRAAVEESNDPEERDTIQFDENVFDGKLASTIVLGSSLPILQPVLIHGRECPTGAGIGGPCVGIDGPGLSSGPALGIENAEEVEIEGLAVTGAETGIDAESSSHLRIQSSWFGVRLDGSGGGNGTGVYVGPGSSRSRIGGEGPEAGNVFANSGGDGLDIHGASHVSVLGNYFGIEKDGLTPAANGGKDIEVTSTSSGEFEATGTAIGTRVRAEGVATPKCDLGCNVISGAGSDGIDLEGDGEPEAPATATTIAGNYIGLDATGNAAVPNASAGVHVGRAAQTVVGGPSAGEANRINGGSAGVLAGPEAADLAVRGNLIGVDAGGAASLAPPGEGISVVSGEFSTPALEAVIAGNEIRMEGGVAIAQQGFGAWIAGNEIAGAETGIKTFEYTAEHGNLIEGNSIEAVKAGGILVENDLNEILGNEVTGAGGAGIAIRGLEPFGVSGNLVGGDAAADENVVSGSGGAAIEISDVNTSVNEVARNRGSANSGLFIDLVPAGAESKDPNNGIEPPVVSTAIEASADGSAEPGAVVRVFHKLAAAPGELDSFLGETIADAEGNWKVVYGSAIPAGTFVAATQTKDGGTSELSTPAAVAGGGSATGGGGDGDAGGGAGTAGSFERVLVIRGRTRPRTKLVRTPRSRTRSSAVRFEFKSDEPGSVFLCKLDDKPFDLCKSPKRYEGLKPGRHVFKVRAVDPAGHVDSSPATKKFAVIG